MVMIAYARKPERYAVCGHLTVFRRYGKRIGTVHGVCRACAYNGIVDSLRDGLIGSRNWSVI